MTAARLIAAACCAVLVPAAALAAGDAGGEHHASINPKTLALQFLNFGVLVFLLGYFGGRAVNKALRARHDQLKNDLEEASKARAAAEARLKVQEKRLANLEQELAAMRASIVQDADKERARIIAAAQEKALQVQEDTKFQLEQQIKEAEVRFRAEVALAAARIAEDMLKRAVTTGDEQRLAQSFIAELGAGGRGPDKGPPRPRPRDEVQG